MNIWIFHWDKRSNKVYLLPTDEGQELQADDESKRKFISYVLKNYELGMSIKSVWNFRKTNERVVPPNLKRISFQ